MEEPRSKRRLKGDEANEILDGGAGHPIFRMSTRSQATLPSSSQGPILGPAGEVGVVQRAPHPLLLPMVLNRLFELCEPNAKDFKNYRLVCKAWEEASLDQWRKHMVLKLCRDDEAFSGPGIVARDFVRLVTCKKYESLKLKLKPFRRLKLVGFNFVLKRNRPTPNFIKVWETFAPKITSLEFLNCTLKFDDPLTKLLSPITGLKEFVLARDCEVEIMSNLRFPPGVSAKSVVLEFTHNSNPADCLKYFRNVEELKLVKEFPAEYYSSSTYELLRQAVLETSNNALFGNLKILDSTSFPFFFRSLGFQGYFNLLSELNLSLEYLSIRLLKPDETPNSFEDQLKAIVSCYSATLETFKVFIVPTLIENGPPSDAFPFGIPMPNLKELYLWGDVTSNLQFLKFMPQLELVHISTWGFDKVDYGTEVWHNGDYAPYDRGFWYSRAFQMDLVRNVSQLGFGLDMEGLVMGNLTKLHIDCPLGRKSIGVLGLWMPHLKTLKIFVKSGNHLQKVCQTWPDLEELVLLRESFIDDGAIVDSITGGSPNCVADLRRLKIFEFDFHCSCNPTSLTERSIYEGFLKMDSLQTLTVLVDPGISKEAEDALKAKSSLLSINLVRARKLCRHEVFKLWIRAYATGLEGVMREPSFSQLSAELLNATAHVSW